MTGSTYLTWVDALSLAGGAPPGAALPGTMGPRPGQPFPAAAGQPPGAVGSAIAGPPLRPGTSPWPGPQPLQQGHPPAVSQAAMSYSMQPPQQLGVRPPGPQGGAFPRPILGPPSAGRPVAGPGTAVPGPQQQYQTAAPYPQQPPPMQQQPRPMPQQQPQMQGQQQMYYGTPHAADMARPPVPGMMPPGPPIPGFAPPHGPPPPTAGGVPGGMGPYAAQRLVEQFESLMLAAGPGAPEADIRSFPRPVGEECSVARVPQQPFDKANCTPDNMRPTVMGVPNSTALRLRWQLPLGVVVRPMADEAFGRSVPVIPLGSQGIVRCRRCRTYMNPFCAWVDGGRRFKCNVCAMLNEVPVDYFSTLDADGIRRDIMERPELHCGTVEWVAPAEYMVRPPMPPVYFFAIDVSAAAYACGMVSVVCETIKACLDKLPGDERTQVGFLTYDNGLHFYNLKPTLAAPQMLVVPELDDPFLPLPDDLLVNLSESRAVVEALLEALPAGYSSSTSNDCATGPALQAAYLAMSHVGGKLLLFQAGLPSLGVGRVKPSRDNLSLYNTEREPNLRNPEDPFFKRFAGEASSRQITLDVFCGANGYTDLASLSSIAKYTCGQVYYYPGFHAGRDGRKLAAELERNLTRPTAWEAVMRIRCSRGLKISSFHGHFFNRSTDLLALPTCDPDKAFAVQIGHEETMVSGPVSFVQCALLHTSSSGERRIRVHTMMLPVLTELSELYRAADGAAIACLLAKLGVEKSLMAKLEETRQALMGKLSAALKEYRLLHGAHVRNPGALIYPSTLRYLPAYILGLTRTTAFRGMGREVSSDDRAAAAHWLMAAPVEDTLLASYPDVYELTNPTRDDWGNQTGNMVTLPPTVPASLAYLRGDGCYLLDNGQMLILWIGRDVGPAWLSQVFGQEALQTAVDVSQIPLEPPQQSPLSQRICRVIFHLRNAHASSFAAAFAVRQSTPMEAHVVPLFVEDRVAGALGYGDFLMQLHRAVMSK
eukprot:GHUV01012479.1.p1 GENE.GHUV01012479.1~~GHUV01012479.1.p1  ORF type:complete len:992 (+),score=282.52 GHUV01012479.1:492-3467(+)